MSIFQILKQHPEISIVFLVSFIMIFVLLDGPVFSYALSNTPVGKIFKTEPDTAPVQKIRGYNTVSTKKPANAGDTENKENNIISYSQDLLTIPQINVSAPIIYSASNNEADIQKDLEKGVAHFNGTAMPGEKGKILIIGHSSVPSGYKGIYGTVFTPLNDLKIGDKISIYSRNKKYTYEVYNKEITDPVLKNLDEKTEDSILILMTCWPPGTTWKRLFVYTKQIN